MNADAALVTIADQLAIRREDMIRAWLARVAGDPGSAGQVLPRAALIDHIPVLLSTFEYCLRSPDGTAAETRSEQSAADHGMLRWEQGYDLRDVVRELGKLNECVIAELDSLAADEAPGWQPALTAARLEWARLHRGDLEASFNQFARLQQQEAEAQVEELESALARLRELEQQRGDLWLHASHELRGNLGVVSNATAGLRRHGRDEAAGNDFMRIMLRNLTSFHHLLDDVSALARLQAHDEHRHLAGIATFDAAGILHEVCDSLRPQIEERCGSLDGHGPPTFPVAGDADKVRRIAHNLVLQGANDPHSGRITLTWGDSSPDDPHRWLLAVAIATGDGSAGVAADPWRSGGIGMSLVRRLCEVLHAALETDCPPGGGFCCRAYIPRSYAGLRAEGAPG